MSSSTLRIETPEVFAPLLGPARYKGAWGGRGSGKSHFFAESLIEACLLERTDAVCIREVQRTLDESVKKLLEVKIDALGVGHLFRIRDRMIEAPHGGRIIFEGMQNHTAESIKSLEGYRLCWVEEAQTLSQRSLDLLRPTIRAENSELWFSWNPNHATDPVDALLRGGDPPPGSVVVKANWEDNPWFPPADRPGGDRHRPLRGSTESHASTGSRRRCRASCWSFLTVSWGWPSTSRRTASGPYSWARQP